MKRFDDDALERLRALFSRLPADEIEESQLRRACVMIPLIRSGQGWSLLFSQRAEDLPVHSGQISFPGGSIQEPESLEDAALRETEEEVGIPRAKVELIGRLDDVVTRTGFLVASFIGVVSTRLDYVLQPSEVAEVFEVPIEALLDGNNPEVRYIEYKNDTYPIYFYCFESKEIWGLTGRILKAFLDVVRQAI